MAAPMVTGAMALALGQRSYNTTQLKSLTLAAPLTADLIDLKNVSTLAGLLGSGRLNLERFIRAALAL